MSKRQKKLEKVSYWTKKYGAWAAGFFRFTPGLRFPGHFSCGALGLSPAKFVAVDGTAALLSVPPQVFLIAFFGEPILKYLKQFKVVIAILVILALIAFVINKYYYRKKMAASA